MNDRSSILNSSSLSSCPILPYKPVTSHGMHAGAASAQSAASAQRLMRAVGTGTLFGVASYSITYLLQCYVRNVIYLN